MLSMIGARRAPIRIIDPYLKTTFWDELTGALKGHRRIRWQGTPMPTLSPLVSSHKRLAAATNFARTDGRSRLRCAVALNAPVELVEQHHQLTSWGKQQVDPSARVCYSANAHQSSTELRYLLFEQRLLQSKIVFHQHGGGYGVDEQHPGEFHDILLSDVFYTWGWSRPDLGSRVRPLSAALSTGDTENSTGEYLLMSLPVTSHFYRLQSFLLPSHVVANVTQTVAFMNHLVADTKVCVRSSGLDRFPMQLLRGSSATISIDNSGLSGVSAASRASLVIHNYLGTSWLETLAMNIPTVCFYDPAVFRPRESARPYFELLTRVGVLHHSGAAAARFVNDLQGNPASWWQKSEVQEARETFVARYANFKVDWLPGWLQEFERLLAE